MNPRLDRYLDAAVQTMPHLITTMVQVAVQSGELSNDEVLEMMGSIGTRARMGLLKGDACSTSLLALPGVRKVCLSTMYLSTRGHAVESVVASVHMMTAPYLRVVTNELTTFVELSGEPLNEFAMYGIQTLKGNPYTNKIVQQVCNDDGWYRPSPDTPEGLEMLKQATETWQSMLDVVNSSTRFKAEIEAFRKVEF